MKGPNRDGAGHSQAVVAGDVERAGNLTCRAGASEFSIAGADASAAGANPYELLSASLAACTAVTIRFQAKQLKIPLSYIEISVSYHHGGIGSRDVFQRSMKLKGNLGDGERAQLMQAAEMCPVGRALGLSADIRTNDSLSMGPEASYDKDLGELSIPNIDPD